MKKARQKRAGNAAQENAAANEASRSTELISPAVASSFYHMRGLRTTMVAKYNRLRRPTAYQGETGSVRIRGALSEEWAASPLGGPWRGEALAFGTAGRVGARSHNADAAGLAIDSTPCLQLWQNTVLQLIDRITYTDLSSFKQRPRVA